MGICTIGACASVYGLFTFPRMLKWYCASAGLGCSVVGLLADANCRKTLSIYHTLDDVSRVARATTVYQEMTQPQPQLRPDYRPFDWETLRTQRDKYPHILILGATGDGKSTLAENLSALLSPSVTYAVVPHWQQGDFASCDHIIGAGRNVGDGIEGDPLSNKPLYHFGEWGDIHQVTVTEFLHALYWEMDRRYKLDTQGNFLGASESVITVILDEFLLYAKLPGVTAIWKALARESRKVGIRLILLVQGDSVASLGIEGEGNIRENLTYIYLAEFALNHLQTCYNRATPEQLPYYQWVSEQLEHNRPCMVEREYAIIPQPKQYVNARQTAQIGVINQVTPLDQRPSESRAAADVRGDGEDSAMWSSSVSVGTQATYDQGDEPAEDFLAGYDEVTASLTPDQLERSLRGLWDTAKDASSLRTPAGNPYTREHIIKKVWGYQSSQYKVGKVLWVLAEQRYGKIPLKE